jgi:hypothetical protein
MARKIRIAPYANLSTGFRQDGTMPGPMKPPVVATQVVATAVVATAQALS